MTTSSTRNTALRLFLDQYELAEHEVAHQADVPRVTMWRAVRGQSVTESHAAAIRKAIWQLSGEYYGGPIVTGDEPVVDVRSGREQRSGGV